MKKKKDAAEAYFFILGGVDEQNRPTTPPKPPQGAGPTDTNKTAMQAKAESAVKVASAFKDLASPANLFLLAALAVLFLIGLFGGWDKLAEKKTAVPTASLGQELVANPFKLKFSKGFWFTHVPDLYSLRSDERGLLVTVDVTNVSKAPVEGEELERAFRLTEGGLLSLGSPVASEKAAPEIKRGADLRTAYAVQPGLPTRLALFWTQKASLPVPKELTLVVYKQTFRQSRLDGSMRYFDPTETVTVKVPLSEFKVPQ